MTDQAVTPTPAPKKRTRTRKPKNDLRTAFLAASRPSECARIVGMDGKALRTILRSKLKVYVSHGDAFDAKIKAQLWDALPAKYRDA